MKKTHQVISSIAVMLCLSGCVAMADMAGASTQRVNQSAAASYDKAMYGFRNQGKIDTRSRTARRVQTVFNRLLPYARQANKTGTRFNWRMNVVKENNVNAWAMPGGKMAVYTGLVNKLKLTDAEIAAVVGHEMVHALAEHSRQQIGSQVASRMVLGTVASQVQLTNSAQLDNYLYGAFQEFGLNRPFGRHMELEADSKGMMLMAKAGYNPQAAISLQGKMQRQGKGIPGFLSTHPTSSTRLAALKANLPRAQAVYRP